jgi:4-alpha-glucanotransferase
MILPVEDLLGVEEQPNLPNTVEEHPNWRRRLPARPLDQPDAQRRLRMAMETRQ